MKVCYGKEEEASRAKRHRFKQTLSYVFITANTLAIHATTNTFTLEQSVKIASYKRDVHEEEGRGGSVYPG